MNATKTATDIFRIERRDHTVIVWIDDPQRPVNAIGEEFVAQLERLLDELEGDAGARGVVFTSAKPDFCVGVDLALLHAGRSAADGEAFARRTQAAFERIATLDATTVAAIAGRCLGGGLELALACDLRVASDHRSCELGQTEIVLGLMPGGGASVRLPRTVGLVRALELMLSGSIICSSEALDRGLVDFVAPAPIVVEVARERVVAVERAQAGQPGPAKLRTLLARLGELGEVGGGALVERLRELLLEDNAIGRRLVFDQARKRARAKAGGTKPAVDRILEVVETGLREGAEAGLAAEARGFGELQASAESRELIGLIFVARELAGELADELEPRPVARVGIIGAASMGSGIAQLSAAHGARVRLHDPSADQLGAGLRRVRKLTEASGELTAFERRVTMARVGPTLRFDDLRSCSIIIEAASEELAVKRELLRRCEALGREDQIFAASASASPISRIAAGCRRPERVIGMHYAWPVETMALVEIVATEQTAPEVIAACVGLAKRQGKPVIVVNDGVGSYITRIRAAYLNEAFTLLGRGAAIDAIDEALVDWGFARGPFALADQIGLDSVAKTGEFMTELGARFEPPPALTQLVDAGFLGRDAERLYQREGQPNLRVYSALKASLGVERDSALMPERDLALCCALRMIDEAARCLDERVLDLARDGDVGAVFGLGYPSWRGGPFRTIASLGADKLRDEFARLGLSSVARRERVVEELRATGS